MTSILENKIKMLKEDPYTYANNMSINDLETIIKKAADVYYNTENSIVSDAIYDMLIDFLTLKDPKNKLLKEVGSSVKNKKKMVELPYWLGSMDKIKPPSNKLDNWKKKYKAPYILTDKLDGISGLLTYNNDKIMFYTRGTATQGQDITKLLKYISNIPTYESIMKYCNKNKLKGKVTDIAFRGELIMKKSIFDKNWSSKLRNARNTTAGLVNSKKVNPKLAKDTDFVLYEIVDPVMPMQDQMKIISDLKFNKVNDKEVKEINYDMLSKYLVERRKNSKYIIDGIIITNKDKHLKNTKGNPKYAFAFKDVLEDQIAKTEVLSVQWKISKDGYIKPVLNLKPVDIGGVTIKRVTAFNAKFIKDNKLGKGAKIELIRSGDVIPYVRKVLKKAKKVEMPDGEWEWNDTGVDIICKDCNNRDVKIQEIYYFFSKLGTKGMGERVVEKLYNSGLDSIEKILNAKKFEFLEVEGFKEKSATNLTNSIKEAMTDIPLEKLMGASNKLGHGIGSRKAKSVLDVYPNLMTEYKKWTQKTFLDNIREIEGWQQKSGKVFINNFPKFVDFYKKIKKFVTLKEKKKVVKNNQFSGKTFVMSGFRDQILKDILEELGATITTSVSKNTDYLIVKDKSVIEKATSKIKKAQELGVIIKTRDEINKLVKSIVV